ncbi:hypothetical protein FIBSPDRAFT_233204 [Athelia psychrophila]|uniref:Uncharacterized protein n=1 Tax=Athelia psychrophila TaxID=1759441 RepID=A0A165YHK6_9AGAM|nr:hypothetical protein FIBSPDRAFT_233204 [Fibularhizoctonia sp. CBS 109695]
MQPVQGVKPTSNVPVLSLIASIHKFNERRMQVQPFSAADILLMLGSIAFAELLPVSDADHEDNSQQYIPPYRDVPFGVPITPHTLKRNRQRLLSLVAALALLELDCFTSAMRKKALPSRCRRTNIAL